MTGALLQKAAMKQKMHHIMAVTKNNILKALLCVSLLKANNNGILE